MPTTPILIDIMFCNLLAYLGIYLFAICRGSDIRADYARYKILVVRQNSQQMHLLADGSPRGGDFRIVALAKARMLALGKPSYDAWPTV
jgi:hypothetical protein